MLGATTIWDLLKVVTAFTLAHSLTLTLAALNLVHLPERLVETLISASIVFVAVQNIFWPEQSNGRSRLAAALFFGLFHGLGFAGELLDLMHQMDRTAIVLAILAFSVGVEVGHQIVILPPIGLTKLARPADVRSQLRMRLLKRLRRVGSAGKAGAGIHYLGTAGLHPRRTTREPRFRNAR